MNLKTAKVPNNVTRAFENAEKYVKKYFSRRKEDPKKGIFEISGERYILVRAASMSIDFFDTLKDLYQSVGEEKAVDVARNLLFDIAHTIGKHDARDFHEKMGLKDPVEKLSAGPIHFAYTGWAFVNIFKESRPSADDNCYLIYDHNHTFEADSWIKKGERSNFPVCVMNAGYSSGWCEESFGVPLVASEILCRAKGNGACRFIMAHPSKIEGYIRDYLESSPKILKKATNYETPGFFKRKNLEEELRKEKDLSQMYFDVAGIMMVVLDKQGNIVDINKKGTEILGYERVNLIGKSWFDMCIPERIRNDVREVHRRSLKGPLVDEYENPVITFEGEERIIKWNNTVLKDDAGNITGSLSSGEDITEVKRARSDREKQIRELEIFYKAAMQREEKILVLKKEIKELKNRMNGSAG